MRYYLRHDPDAKVEGPFTVEALADAIRSGRLHPEALASSDLGDDIRSLQVGRRCDWFPLVAIPELRGVVSRSPEPPVGLRRTSVLMVLVYVSLAFSVSYQTVTEPRWNSALAAVVLVFSTAHALVDRVRRGDTRSKAV